MGGMTSGTESSSTPAGHSLGGGSCPQCPGTTSCCCTVGPLLSPAPPSPLSGGSLHAQQDPRQGSFQAAPPPRAHKAAFNVQWIPPLPVLEKNAGNNRDFMLYLNIMLRSLKKIHRFSLTFMNRLFEKNWGHITFLEHYAPEKVRAIFCPWL